MSTVYFLFGKISWLVVFSDLSLVAFSSSLQFFFLKFPCKVLLALVANYKVEHILIYIATCVANGSHQQAVQGSYIVACGENVMGAKCVYRKSAFVL